MNKKTVSALGRAVANYLNRFGFEPSEDPKVPQRIEVDRLTDDELAPGTVSGEWHSWRTTWVVTEDGRSDKTTLELIACERILKIETKLLHPQAQFPAQGRPGDAGHDLRTVDAFTLAPFERKLVSTGVAIAIPSGFYGQIKDRSGLAAKHGIHVLAGVVDSTYRGEVKVVLINLDTKSDFSAVVGDRIAQIVFLPYAAADFVSVEELDKSERGAGGFGSSGRR